MKKFIITTLLIVSTILTGCASKNQTSEVEAEASDTTKPVITLKGEIVNVVLEKDYEAKDNVKSVTDDTDGTLKYSEKATKDEAYYIVEDKDVNTSKEGTYKVKVTASDKAGNIAEKEFNVVVAKENTDEKKSDSKDATSSKTTDEAKKETASTSKTSSEKKTTSSSSSTSKKTTTSSKSSSSTSGSKKTTSTTTSNSNSNANSSTSSNNSNSGSTSSNSASTSQTDTTANSQPVCNHNWVPITKTVHHDEVGHYNDVYEEHYICNGCGKDFGADDYALGEHAAQVSEEQFLAGCGSGHTERVKVDTQWVVDSAAYDENVITGYRCSSCGATK